MKQLRRAGLVAGDKRLGRTRSVAGRPVDAAKACALHPPGCIGTFQSQPRPRLPPGRPTGVSTSGESRVAGLFLTQPGRVTCTAGHARRGCAAETAHVKPHQPRQTACAPPRYPNRLGALAVHRRGRCRGACGALTGRGNHLFGGIRRHVQLLRTCALQTQRDAREGEGVKNAESTIWNLRPYNPR